MKTILTGAAVAAMLAATIGAAAAQNAAPANYKALRDFSYSNPNGAWSYGYGAGGDAASFVRFPTSLQILGNGFLDSFYDSESTVSLDNTGGTKVLAASASSVVIPTDALVMHPRSDGQDTMVVFTAPAAGFYLMEGFFEILDNAPTSVAPKIFIGSKDQTLKAFSSKNPVVLTGPADPSKKKVGQKKKFSLTRELSVGQRVQFVVNANGDWRFDSTGFDVTITPVPAP
jgi:hypothetical protein